jgi:hypothetical protein
MPAAICLNSTGPSFEKAKRGDIVAVTDLCAITFLVEEELDVSVSRMAMHILAAISAMHGKG